MKNFLYKLLFPFANKLYFGRAANEQRYGKNNLNEQFFGPHHNPEVQNLLDNGEFCFWKLVKEFDTEEELKQAEEIYLQKVWESEDWSSRPFWLMNRSRTSIGGGGFLHLTPEQVQNFQKAGAEAKGGKNNRGRKRPDVSVRMTGNTLGTKTKGRKRPDVSTAMKGNTFGSKNKGRKNDWNKEMNSTPVICPYCDKLIGNKAALGTHIKHKHTKKNV